HGSTKANKYAYAIFNDKSLEEALKKDEAKAALLEQMLERTKQVALFQQLEKIADDDEQMRAMLEQFKAL
ncbi:hypothetical protein VJI72_08000, partial [Parvimonas micra]